MMHCSLPAPHSTTGRLPSIARQVLWWKFTSLEGGFDYNKSHSRSHSERRLLTWIFPEGQADGALALKYRSDGDQRRLPDAAPSKSSSEPSSEPSSDAIFLLRASAGFIAALLPRALVVLAAAPAAPLLRPPCAVRGRKMSVWPAPRGPGFKIGASLFPVQGRSPAVL